MKENKLVPVPEIGKWYYFFDDGKISPSRCYKAKVIRIIPYNEEVIVNKFDYDLSKEISITIQEVHKQEVDDHRQSENFIILGRDTTPGAPWLYAEETDFFIEAEIPGYDKNTIWFTRTVDGGWFSMEIQSSWQCGDLDVDFSKYKYAKETFETFDYDEELKTKGEFIC